MIAAATAALAMAGAGLEAHAQTLGQTTAPRARVEAAAPQLTENPLAQRGRRSLQWNSDGRWGLKLDLDQPVGREADWDDVEAGAYFRINPSLRVGGSVGLGEKDEDPARPAGDQKAQPRVRLETTFRF